MDEEYLEHYGVKGMRWGVRKQKERSSGSGTSSRKKKTLNKKKSLSEKRKAKREAKAAAKVEKAKRKAEQEAVRKEKKRQTNLKDPTKLYKHRNEYTQQEIQDALKQFEWEKKLSDYSKQRLSNGADYINTIFKYSNNAINLYNTAARIANSVNEDSQLPIIKTTKEVLDTKKEKKEKKG